jgi:uncharacterized repeat protein (TIGR01451 family)/LPXTG-motif cell wall-anchored protein
MKAINKLFSWLKTMPVRVGAITVATLTAAVIIPTIATAWGPTRPTFTTAVPATYVTFDSITDNPVQGDERNFMQIKDASAASSTYADSMSLVAGHTYTVFMYYHNDASSSLNASGAGIAHGAYIRTALPNIVSGSNEAGAYIGASNANPTEVYDDVTLTSTSALDINYVPGSAHIYNQGPINGDTLPDSIATTGTPLGYYSLTDGGTLPGCNQYAGYVTYNFTATSSSYTFNKQVSKHGANTWGKTYAAQPGETVDYLLEYRNTGTENNNNVVIKDQLPAGETYIPGSTTYGNATFPNGTKATDDVTTTGINVGNYGPGANAWVLYSAKVNDNGSLPVCGPNTLINNAEANVGSATVPSSANVTTTETCTTPTTPVYTCNGLTASLISGNEYSFKEEPATATNGASVVSYQVNFGDGQSSAATETATTVDHTYAATGETYSPSLSVTFTVNGETKVVSSAACTASLTVGQPPVTPPTTPPTTPTTTPTALPHTGATSPVTAFLGLGSLIASIGYFINSRRALLGR